MNNMIAMLSLCQAIKHLEKSIKSDNDKDRRFQIEACLGRVEEALCSLIEEAKGILPETAELFEKILKQLKFEFEPEEYAFKHSIEIIERAMS